MHCSPISVRYELSLWLRSSSNFSMITVWSNREVRVPIGLRVVVMNNACAIVRESCAMKAVRVEVSDSFRFNYLNKVRNTRMI
jgi:hypothetical protein